MNPKDCRNIEEIRKEIDGIDLQILNLFSQRYAFVKEIVKFKTDEASVVAENRQQEVIEVRRKWAIELGLDPDLFEDMFWLLMKYNVGKELEILRRAQVKEV